MINYQVVPKPYHSLVRGISLLKNPNINAVIAKGKQGLGKSFWVDFAVKEAKLDYVLFKGTISEARFFKYIQDNSDKVIIMRDCGSMLRRLTFLDFLKSATDLSGDRKISRINYSNHEGVEETFTFTGKLIWEINDIPKKNKEDLNAVIDRSLFIEVNPSQEEIKEIMFSICKKKLEIEVTKYLILKINKIGLNNFNFRTQAKCFQIVISALKDKLDWKKQLDMFLDTQVVEIRKILYRFTGYRPVKRMTFVKYYMVETGISYVSTQKKISEHILLGNLYSNGLLKQALISLNPFRNIQNIQKK